LLGRAESKDPFVAQSGPRQRINVFRQGVVKGRNPAERSDEGSLARRSLQEELVQVRESNLRPVLYQGMASAVPQKPKEVGALAPEFF
jgi:hypothetical protein